MWHSSHVEVKGQLSGVGRPFHYVLHGDRMRVSGLGTNAFYSLSHLTSPSYTFKKYKDPANFPILQFIS